MPEQSFSLLLMLKDPCGKQELFKSPTGNISEVDQSTMATCEASEMAESLTSEHFQIQSRISSFGRPKIRLLYKFSTLCEKYVYSMQSFSPNIDQERIHINIISACSMIKIDQVLLHEKLRKFGRECGSGASWYKKACAHF